MGTEPVKPLSLEFVEKLAKRNIIFSDPFTCWEKRGKHLRKWNERSWEVVDVNHRSSWDRRRAGNFNSLFSPDVQPLTMAERGEFGLPELKSIGCCYIIVEVGKHNMQL